MAESICPYCGQTAPNRRAEIAHMERHHPEVIAERLVTAGLLRHLPPEFAAARDTLIAETEPILGHQAASLGAGRLTEFTQGHGNLQAMSLFLTMSVFSAPAAGYNAQALNAVRQDAQDVRDAAEHWAGLCEQLADHWEAQRQEQQR